MRRIILVMLLILTSITSVVKAQEYAPDDELRNLFLERGIPWGSWLSHTYAYFWGLTSFINFGTHNFDPMITTAKTAEFGFEFSSVCTAPYTYNFFYCDSVLNTHKRLDGRRLTVTALIWPSHNRSTILDTLGVPKWLVYGGYDDTTITHMYTHFIDTIIKRYKADVYQWEVTNELSKDNGIDTANYFWSKHVPNWIDLAYETARNADSNGILLYNENDADIAEYYSYNFMNELTKLRSRNVKIDMVGLQAHLTQDTGITANYINPSYGWMFDRIKSLGYKFSVTELDWKIRRGLDTNFQYKIQAKQYADYIKTALEHGVTELNLWGWDDSTSWIKDAYYYHPCIYNVFTGPGQFPIKPAYTAIKNVLLSYDSTTTQSNNRIEIKVNYLKVLECDTAFPYLYNFSNINIPYFWKNVDINGSDIYITDINDNIIPSYLSGFDRTNRKGVIEFTGPINDSVYTTYYLNYNGSYVRSNQTVALTKSGMIFSPDYTSIPKGFIRDKCGNSDLDVLWNMDKYNVDTLGSSFCIKNNGSYATSSRYFDVLRDSIGYMSILTKRDTTDNTSKNVFSLANSTKTHNIRVRCFNYAGKMYNAFSLITPEFVLDSSVGRNIHGSADPDFGDIKYISHSWSNTKWLRHDAVCYYSRVKYGDLSVNYPSAARITIGSDANLQNSFKGKVGNIRLYNVEKSTSFKTAESNMLLNNYSFYIRPTEFIPFRVDSTNVNQWSYKMYLKSDTLNDTCTILTYDSSSGSLSYTVVDSTTNIIPGNSTTINAYFKSPSTTYYIKMLVRSKSTGSYLDTIYDTITTSVSSDTIVDDNVIIKSKGTISKPLKCNYFSISTRDTVNINSSVYVRDSINISPISNKILYNASGKFFGYIYPSNKLYIRTNRVVNLPPVLKASYKTWYIWR